MHEGDLRVLAGERRRGAAGREGVRVVGGVGVAAREERGRAVDDLVRHDARHRVHGALKRMGSFSLAVDGDHDADVARRGWAARRHGEAGGDEDVGGRVAEEHAAVLEVDGRLHERAVVEGPRATRHLVGRHDVLLVEGTEADEAMERIAARVRARVARVAHAVVRLATDELEDVLLQRIEDVGAHVARVADRVVVLVGLRGVPRRRAIVVERRGLREGAARQRVLSGAHEQRAAARHPVEVGVAERVHQRKDGLVVVVAVVAERAS